MAESLPRYTRFWAKQAKMLADADIEAFSDRTVQLRLLRTVELLAASMGSDIVWENETETALAGIRQPTETLEISLDALVNLFIQRSPTAAYAFGLGELKVWCAWRVESQLRLAAGEDAQILLEEAKGRPILTRLAHLLSDNPIEFQADGDIRFYGKATAQHRFQLSNYYRSLKPAERVGRPRKETMPKGTSWAPLDLTRAQQAARMKDERADWTAIAKALLPDFNPADYNPRTRDKARKAVSRLVERGRLERDRPS